MFKNFRQWIGGNFTCRRCGKAYHSMSFGYGEIICPDCYQGENQFIFLDNSYWLNKFLSRMKRIKASTDEDELDNILLDQAVISAELDVFED
jgi:hypothetical protein